jgi:CheY-like chemotaxis protein
MPTAIVVVAADSTTRDRLAALVPADGYSVESCAPDALPAGKPNLYVIALPAIDTPEEQVIEHLRADEQTEQIPIVIASALPMVQLQSVPYASDWTIAIVEEPVSASVLADTMKFLLNPDP